MDDVLKAKKRNKTLISWLWSAFTLDDVLKAKKVKESIDIMIIKFADFLEIPNSTAHTNLMLLRCIAPYNVWVPKKEQLVPVFRLGYALKMEWKHDNFETIFGWSKIDCVHSFCTRFGKYPIFCVYIPKLQ